MDKDEISYKIENFLDTDEVQKVCDFYDSLPYSDEYSSPANRRKLMHYEDENVTLLKDLFEPKLKSLYNKGIVSACTFTEWHNPVEVHTDGWQPQEDKTRKMGYAVLVPLRINPQNAEASTIIFSQRHHGPTLTLKEHVEDDSWNVAEHISPDDERIEHKSNNALDNKIYDKHLKHIEPQILRNFTVSSVHDWALGSAIVWDRSYFHTSSSFANNLKSKLHAIFFVTLDD